MRVFSQIHNSSQPSEIIQRSIPLVQNDLRQNRMNQQRDQILVEKNNLNKQAFRLQPEQFFEINRQVQHEFNTIPPHIWVQNESEDQQEEVSKVNHRQIKPRRLKIFNDTDPIKLLLNGGKFQQRKQEPIRQKEQYQRRERIFKNQAPEIIHAKKIKSTEVSQYQNSLNTVHHNQQYMKIKKENDDYQRVKTSKILQQPILKIGQTLSNSKSVNYQLQNILSSYPKVIQRLEANENDIVFLKNRLQQKNSSNNMQQRSYFITSEANQLSEINQKKAILNRVQQKEVYNPKKKVLSQLQIQRERRLQNLIQQNQYLCSKVLEQRQRIRRQNQQSRQIQIQNDISPMERARRMQNYKMTSLQYKSLSNLNISAIPESYSGNHQMEDQRQIRRNLSRNEATLYHNKTVQNFYYPKQPQNIFVKKLIVPISKIY